MKTNPYPSLKGSVGLSEGDVMENKRWDNMVEMHGSEEAAKAEMARRGSLSSRNKGKQGGFAKLKSEDPEKFKELTSKGGKRSGRRDTPDSDMGGNPV